MSVTKIFKFDAAHFLPEHSGKCAELHGHTYRLEVTVARRDGGLVAEGSSTGMVLDFGDLKAIVKREIIEKVDHKMLNDVFSFRTTAENMVIYFHKVLEQELVPLGIEVLKLRLWETPTSFAEVAK
ncbi:MAG: 6-carboxytetrahydropterin synthase QueD [Acidaminococcaceae bacterium]